jgi:putative Holliday junction resolvase
MPDLFMCAFDMHSQAGGQSSLTLLGFDYGERRIGVAVGQTITATATPLKTILNRGVESDWHIIARLIDEWRPDAIIVGIPKTGDNSRHVLEKAILHFCHALVNTFRLPVYTVDESYSSSEAYQRLKNQRNTRGRRRLTKGDIDRLAAAILLETWMASQAIGTTKTNGTTQ